MPYESAQPTTSVSIRLVSFRPLVMSHGVVSFINAFAKAVRLGYSIVFTVALEMVRKGVARSGLGSNQ